MQLLDNYESPIVFTTNFIQNYDTAFFRRITAHVEFRMPDVEARGKLWSHYLVPNLPYKGHREEIIDSIAINDNLTGAEIAN